eukprot:15474401-Alexandrium_andersonii.AAC.2
MCIRDRRSREEPAARRHPALSSLPGRSAAARGCRAAWRCPRPSSVLPSKRRSRPSPGQET